MLSVDRVRSLAVDVGVGNEKLGIWISMILIVGPIRSFTGNGLFERRISINLSAGCIRSLLLVVGGRWISLSMRGSRVSKFSGNGK